VNWSLLDELTGTGSNDLNAVWYMMMLGADLGWDLPFVGQPNNGSYVYHADPTLDYASLKYGYNGPSNAGCGGNGSRTGIQTGNQTVGQGLSIAQQNGRHVTGPEVDDIVKDIRALSRDVKTVSADNDAALELTSPLREAVRLLEPALSSPRGSVSATTPTHLTESFIRSALLHIKDLGESNTDHLTTEAYCVIGELEGQGQPGRQCRSSSTVAAN
jgi:hypothetical protein